MTTRRDFLKTMSLASAGLALGSGELLNAQTISSKKGRNDYIENRGDHLHHGSVICDDCIKIHQIGKHKTYK